VARNTHLSIDIATQLNLPPENKRKRKAGNFEIASPPFFLNCRPIRLVEIDLNDKKQKDERHDTDDG
jgi:hypothetical protein